MDFSNLKYADIDMLTIGVLTFISYGIIFLTKSSIFTHQLTQFQKNNRTELMFKQAAIMLACMIIPLLMMHNVSENNFELANKVILGLAIVVFISSFFITSRIKKIDNKKIKAKLESTFNFAPNLKKVKPISYYSHYFANLKLSKNQKNSTIDRVTTTLSKNQVQTYIDTQENKPFVQSEFYTHLISYINSKSSQFNFEKLKIEELEKTNLLQAKISIFQTFENLEKNKYWASISQLFQIANQDEAQFLSFLRDSQHQKYSSLSVLTAAAFAKKGIL